MKLTEWNPSADPHTTNSRAVHCIQHLVEHLAQRNLTQPASSLTFTSILAMVPLLTVVLSIFTAFPIFQDFQVSLEEFLTSKLMPDAVRSEEHTSELQSRGQLVCRLLRERKNMSKEQAS